MNKDYGLNESWLNGSYDLEGVEVTIDTNLDFIAIENLPHTEDFHAQGDSGMQVIREIFEYWNKMDVIIEEAILWWINTYL